jgi:hypothetical protein
VDKLTRTTELLRERSGGLPVWIRPPKSGCDYWCGLSRSKLYQLAQEQKIKSRSIREPGQIKGTRLFELRSILDFIERSEAGSAR